MQIMSPERVTPVQLIAIVCILIAACGGTPAQAEQPGTAQPSTAPQTDPLPELPISEAVPLSGETIEFESAGLTIPLTEEMTGGLVPATSGQMIRVILPENAGAIVVQQRAERAQLDADQILSAQIKRAVGLERVVGVIDLDQRLETDTAALFASGQPIPLGLRPARPHYIRESADETDDGVRGITGITIVTLPAARDESRFAQFRLITTESAFDRARAHYEAVLASATIDDPANLNRARRSALERGLDARQIFLNGALRNHAETRIDTWQRLHQPTDDADDDQPQQTPQAGTEAGYRRIRLYPGVRGDARGIPRDRMTESDTQPGFVLELDARLLIDPRAGPEAGMIDTRAVYFLSENADEELWTARSAVRRGRGDPESWVEVGGRSGRSMTVSIDRGQAPTRQVRPVIEGQGYISRVTSFLLPELLAITDQAGPDGDPRELAFYAYDQNNERIRLRTDRVERHGDGRYRIETTFAAAAPQTSLVSQDGTVLRTELPTGLVWQAIELDALVELWRSKGLPID